MSTLFDLFGFGFREPKAAKPVLTVDLMSDIPAEAFIRALKDAGLTIKEQEGRGRLVICKAEPKRRDEGPFVVWGGDDEKPKRRRKSRGN